MDTRNIEDIYKLSPVQRGLLFQALYAPESAVSFEQASRIIERDLDGSAVFAAWQKVIERHPILRTAFFWEKLDEPLQMVSRQVDLPFEQLDWREFDPDEQQRRLKAFLEADQRHRFDLSKAPLMRLALIRLGEARYNQVWSYHHILLDGWSVTVVMEEVWTFLDAIMEGRALELPLPRPFRDYVTWLQQRDWEEAKEFWRQKLEGFTTPTSLGVDQALGNLPNLKADFGRQEIRLSNETTEAIRAFVRQHRITVGTLVQAAWALLLSRCGGEDDVLFGVVVHGRSAMSGCESMVGLFINALPVRVRVPSSGSVVDWLSTLHAEFAKLIRYDYTPLMQVQSWNGVLRNKMMFDYLVVDQSYRGRAPVRAGSQLFELTGYPMTVYFDLGEMLILRITYECGRFDEDTVAQILRHLHTLLTGMIADPYQPLAELSLLTLEETQQIVHDWNDTTASYPKTATLQQLFTAQASRTPKSTAITFENEQLTYTELNRRANQLAHYLRACGVEPDTRVGLCVERSLDMMVALIGILKAGGVYVPLDPAYPDQRLASMIQDAQIKLLLTQAGLAANLPQMDAPVLCLDRDWNTIAQESTDDPQDVAEPDHLAYVIYTSGSTGQPKAVMVSQQALVQYVTTAIDHFAITPEDRVLQFASISFDTAAEEIYPCLLGGATLVLRTEAMLDSVETFLRMCAAQDITVLNFPTAYWHAITLELEESSLAFHPSLRLVIIGGEAASPEHLKKWQEHASVHIRLVNTYGPTETTIVATRCDLTGKDAPASAARAPIGRPGTNTQVYVLDRYMQPVSVGVPGELYIGGDGVTRGYLNRPELTAAVFVPDPFSPNGKEGKRGARLYKTGDLTRYLSDGNLEFLGRVDHQVKIRGFRVELGEVESVLAQHPAVREAVVLAREDVPGDRRLVAYVTSNQEQALTTTELHGFLKEKLPAYMVPAAFVFLDTLPLTPGRKVDRRALPAPEGARPELEKAYVAPRTLSEERLAEIWARLLGVDRVGIYDNFFELGGHSMLATQLVAHVQNAFQIELSLHLLFEQSTIAELAATVDKILLEEIASLSEEEALRLLEEGS